MKGPSLDAIRKFKQQQEQKKREEDEKKVKEKLTTLEHRAAQGDKKAKSQLKKIEKVKDDRNRPPDNSQAQHREQHDTRQSSRLGGHPPSGNTNVKGSVTRKPKKQETDFEELMKLAKNNKNEVKCVKKPKLEIRKVSPRPKPDPREEKVSHIPVSAVVNRDRPISGKQHIASKTARTTASSQPSRSRNVPHRQPPMPQQPPIHHRPRPPIRRDYYREQDDYDDDEEEDEYESDGFVVNDDDDEVQDELSKTLKSVFRYDKRRCDLREQELDRQYRAIGRVSTFEDLEREERRASKLAAAEDARAFREEEERKRLKKKRLKGLRD